MAQLFHPSFNTIAKVSIVGAVVGILALSGAVYAGNITYGVKQNVPLQQPVEFSHKHHVTDDGIDCRYCHQSVDKAAFAGLPATEVCMTCHSQIWTDSPLLEPVRESWRTGQPISWARVHDLPDFVYFNHSIHVNKGISCVSCHGRVDEMPLTWKENTLSMDWCLKCHRHPEKFIRPKDRVYDLAWEPQMDQVEMGMRLLKEYKIMPQYQLTNCSICHH